MPLRENFARPATLAATLMVWLAIPATAQVGLGCVISALNRSAPVDANGVWVLPNVPSSMGQVRLRATCTDGGVTRHGQSGFVTVPANGVVQVSQISFDDPTPVPATLALAATPTELDTLGQLSPITATATYPDGSTAQVSSSPGTTYSTSNPMILSVSPAGVAAAVGSGAAIVIATHDGAVAFLRFTVVIGGDADGDGLPDDWELSHGLDPSDPIDALLDPDMDGLTTVEEFQLGLDPFRADTDGDGLSDGDEVRTIGTDPLLFDTDGDGFSDGLEVSTGSDPLDPASWNLGAAASSLAVEPASFTLIFNTVLGEASRQLRVVAHLLDGTELDVTGGSWGTSYGSSDLSVASFGAEPGRVFAGAAGLATVAASNGALQASAEVTVDNVAPAALAFLPLAGARDVVVAGDWAYVAGETGLSVVDVSTPTAPRLARQVLAPQGRAVARLGEHVIVARTRGLTVVDVSNPETATVIAELPLPFTDSVAVAAVGERAYVAGPAGRLWLVDLSDPGVPTVEGNALLGFPRGYARGVDVGRGLAVVVSSAGEVRVVDVSEPATPVSLGLLGGATFGSGVQVRDDVAYLASGQLELVSLADPRAPSLLVRTREAGIFLADLALAGRFVLAADSAAPRQPIFDISPTPPVLSAVIDPGGVALRVAVEAGLVFHVWVKATGQVGLMVSRWAALRDDAGIAPAVSILEPVVGAAVAERSRLRVVAEATDDLGVASVSFLVDGVLMATDDAPPWEAVLRTPSGVGSILLSAEARDWGGNVGVSEPVLLPVVPDQAPSAFIVAPAAGASFAAGSVQTVLVAAEDDVGVVAVDVLVDGAFAGTANEEPWAVATAMPGALGDVELTAVAYDSGGPSTPSEPVVIHLVPDAAPSVAIVRPQPFESLVAGQPTLVEVAAYDDAGLQWVRISVADQSGSVLSKEDTAAPYDAILVPPGGGALGISAVARDTAGHEVSSNPVTVLVPAGPPAPTTVTGTVVDGAGVPVVGAEVEVSTEHGTSLGTATLSDGTFAILSVPAGEGYLFVRAAVLGGGCAIAASLDVRLTPIPGGEISAGTLAVAEGPEGSTTRVIGRVVDGAGEPVGGATVAVFEAQFFDAGFAVTAADGTFAVPEIAFGAGGESADFLGLAVRAPAPGGWWRASGLMLEGMRGAVSDAGTVTVSFEADPGDPLTTVVGVVVDGDGAAVAGASVLVTNGADVWATRSGEGGSFTLSGAPALEGDLEARATATVDCVTLETDVAGEGLLVPGGITDLGNVVIRDFSSGGPALTAPGQVASD